MESLVITPFPKLGHANSDDEQGHRRVDWRWLQRGQHVADDGVPLAVYWDEADLDQLDSVAAGLVGSPWSFHCCRVRLTRPDWLIAVEHCDGRSVLEFPDASTHQMLEWKNATRNGIWVLPASCTNAPVS